MKIIVQVEPKDVYEQFPAKIKEACDSLVKSLMEFGCFDTEQQARDWATIQFWNGMKKLAEEQK